MIPLNDKQHIPVLKEECVEFILSDNKKDPLLLADLTFGGGGHSFSFLHFNPSVKIMAFDQDEEAILLGRKLVKKQGWEDNIQLVHKNFKDVPLHICKRMKTDREIFDGILLDLGVSTYQLKTPERGFSFRLNGPLDMRMNQKDASLTAQDIVNKYSIDRLEGLFREYGEEIHAKKISTVICKAREEKLIETTKELEELIFYCYPKRHRHGRTHPATRCFQALRIHVNNELSVLSDTIPRLIPLLKKGRRLLIISFHSLEDRIVKRAFKELSENSVKILTKRPIRPNGEEMKENYRSRSAKLRVLQKL